MKIKATDLTVGMEIQIESLFDNSKGSVAKEYDFSIETIGLKKSSPIYKVTSVTSPVKTKVYRTQHKTNVSKVLVLTLEGVTGTVEVSTKQKVKLIA